MGRSAPATTTASAPSVPAGGDPDGSFTLAVGAAPSTWNPHAASGAGAPGQAVLGGVWPSVWQVAPDGSLELDTAFVTSATQTSASPQTVVYRINPEATWSDGAAITWRDFAYNWQAQSGSTRYRDVGGRPFAAASTAGYSQIASVTAAGSPDVVRVVFATPDPDWQALFSTLVPAHVAERVGWSTGFGDPVADDVSGGPFLVQSFDGASVTEVRNPRYWGPPSGLSSVTFRFVASAAEVPEALAGGLVDGAVVSPSASVVAAIRSLAPSVSYDQVDGDTWDDLLFEQANRWLKDPAIRQAVSLAVDRTAIVAKVVGSYDPTALPLGNHFLVPGQAGYEDDSGNLYGDAQDTKALQVLEAAGYSYQAGTLSQRGVAVALRVTCSASDPIDVAVAGLVATELAGIGIDATVVHAPDMAATVASGAYDVAVGERTDSPYLSSQDALYVPGNASSYSDPAVTALLAGAATTFDPAARQSLYDQVDVQLWRDNVDLPLFQRAVAVASSGPIEGFAANPSADGPTWDVATWTDRASGS